MNLVFFIFLGSSFSLRLQSHLTPAAGKREMGGQTLTGGLFSSPKTHLRKPQILPFLISESSVFQMILSYTLDLSKCIFYAVLI